MGKKFFEVKSLGVVKKNEGSLEPDYKATIRQLRCWEEHQAAGVQMGKCSLCLHPRHRPFYPKRFVLITLL